MGKFEKKPPKKKINKGFAIVLAVILILAAVTAVWMFANYHIVSWRLYPRDAAFLDLRERELTTVQYDKIRQKLSDCEIRWNIPFQGGKLADDTQEITVSTLTEADVAQLAYAHQLKRVHAEGCTDYEALELLRQSRPELEVVYTVAFSGGNHSWDVDTLRLNSVTAEDIGLLKHLPRLEVVALEAGDYDSSVVASLREAVKNAGMVFGVVIGGQILEDTEAEREIVGITEAELGLPEHLSMLRKLTLVDPDASAEALLALESRIPQVELNWKVTFGDLTYDRTATQADLTMVEITDLSLTERKLASLPDLEQVTFGLCGVDDPEWGNSKSELAASVIENEDMAAYRDRVRGDYKVVWTVRLGPVIALRTDADNFMPTHFNIGRLPDSHAYNLRYCEDMVCLDVGHMTLTDISFVSFMPRLKYLILAWTGVQYIEPIRACKELIFLELDNSPIRDISPLVDCTALQDLNLGNTGCDITPLKEMHWLKNVYMIHRGSAGIVGMALPDTRVVGSDNPKAVTVGFGWRKLPNYYAMRDMLNMPYMD